MSQKLLRFLSLCALYLLIPLVFNHLPSTQAATVTPHQYTPEHIILSRVQERKFLTEPASGDAYDIVLNYLTAHRAELGLQDTDLQLVITDRYVSQHTGVTHLYLQQQINGLLVQGAVINASVTTEGQLVLLSSSFVGDAAEKVNHTAPMLTAEEAVLAAATALNLSLTHPLTRLSPTEGTSQATLFAKSDLSLNDIPAHLVYQPVSPTEIRLAWNVTIYPPDAQDWWDMRLDATNGQVLAQDNWAVHDNWGNVGNGITEKGVGSAAATTIPSAAPDSYQVYALPIESPSHSTPPSPADGRTIATNPATSGSPFGWHDTDGTAGPEFTTTQGNNTHAYTDTDANNLPDPGSSPDGGPTLDFIFPIDLTQHPSTYRPAVVTNLFYANNIIHDVLYEYGFDEASGNFQQNNYGNGGLGNDYVLAEAQDGSGTNGGIFATPPDGSRGRLQMYVWTLTNPHRDGSFDHGITYHEYGHGVSNRLTGGPSNVSCLGNAEQMGEGWSDLLALFLTAQTGDSGLVGRGIGTYVLGQPPTGPGFRPAHYTTDMTVNNYTYANLVTAGNSHGVGFIWATMFWDVYWNLVGAYGFNPDFYGDWSSGGNNLAMQLLIDGMKLQPCGPGFVDGRDAILAADLALTGGTNHCRLWDGFARRGLGVSASQGSPNSITDGTAAFDVPPECFALSTIPSPTSVTVCAGSTAAYQIGVGSSFTAPVTMSGAAAGAAGTAVTFTPNPVTGTLPQVIAMNITTTVGTTAFGTYTVEVSGSGGITASITTTLQVFSQNAAAPTLITPTNSANSVSTTPTFTWSSSTQAVTYTLQIDDNADFSSPEHEITTTDTSYDLPGTQPLNEATPYYWRVIAHNICGSTASDPFSFTTLATMQSLYLPLLQN